MHKSGAKISPSVTAGVLLVTDETSWPWGSSIPRDNLNYESEPYIGDDFPQTGYAIEVPAGVQRQHL